MLDAFSRTILHQEGFVNENAEAVIRVLKAGLKAGRRKGLKVLSVLSDHGRPYKSARVRQYIRENRICCNLATPYRPEGKAAIERYFKTVKKTFSSRSRLVSLFFQGVLIWLKTHLVKTVFNTILLGYTGLYNRTRLPSPQSRLTGTIRPRFQESVMQVLQAEEKESELKNELIDHLYKEFFAVWNAEKVNKTKIKRYLYRYRKETIKSAAEALRRKLVVAELSSENRWWYLSKVAYNIDKAKRQEQVARDRQVIHEEQMNAQREEEMARIEEEKRWNENHPESAMKKAVGWYLLLCNYPIARRYYQREIVRITERIMLRHSIFTAGLKMKKLCEWINNTDGCAINTDMGEHQGMVLPTAGEIEKAKADLIKLLKEQYSGQQGKDVANLQNLKTLWMK